MKIKLSDYILEQSISNASIDDIEFETALAELSVNAKIMEYYLKQMNMGVVMEAAPAQQPPTMPTKDQLMPNSSYVQSYDTDTSEAVAQALRDIGCEVSTSDAGDRSSVRGYFEIQSYDGGNPEVYAISYYPANSAVKVVLRNGYSEGNPYLRSNSENKQFKIDTNKNIKSQLQNIASKVNKDLQKFYTSREDYKDYKANPNDDFYKGYRDNVDVGLNEGMGNAMKNALKDNAIKGVTGVAQIVALVWSILRLAATVIPLLYSVLNKLKRAAGMESRSDADAKMIGNFISSDLAFSARELDNAFTADHSNTIKEVSFITDTVHSIDEMFYTLQAINILTKKSDINGAEDFQNMVSEYQKMIQRAISKAQTEDMNAKRKSNANWLSDLEKVLNSDRAKAVQSMIQNISEQQFKRQLEQGLQGIDPASMQTIMAETQKLQASIQRDLTKTKTQISKIDQELNKLISQSSYKQFNPNNATRTMTQPQPMQQPQRPQPAQQQPQQTAQQPPQGQLAQMQ
jgi:hypothetical protein